jgi:hypothetical protein
MKECTKKKYNNKNLANKQAKFYFEKDGYKSRAYGCPLCHKVHLTTIKKKL